MKYVLMIMFLTTVCYAKDPVSNTYAFRKEETLEQWGKRLDKVWGEKRDAIIKMWKKLTPKEKELVGLIRIRSRVRGSLIMQSICIDIGIKARKDALETGFNAGYRKGWKHHHEEITKAYLQHLKKETQKVKQNRREGP